MSTIRLSEWGSRRVSDDLSLDTRRAISDAAQLWQQTHRLPQPPLVFGGLDGRTLSARQWVGILEVEGARVEIYPRGNLSKAGCQTPRRRGPRRHYCQLHPE